MRSPTLIALVAAEVVSSLGSAMTFHALPWFVLVTSGSPSRMSVVLAAEILPMAIFGIPSGSVIARYGARTTMLAADAARVPLIALVPLLYWTHHLPFGLLLALVFALGIFQAPYITSQRSIIPEIFGDDETLVSKASGAFGAATQLPIVIGPAIAGVLIASIGTAPLLVVDAATFLFAFVVVLFFVKGGGVIAGDDDSQGVLAGVRYLMRDRLLGPMTLTLIVLDGAANALTVAVPLLAYTRYHRDPHVAGWVFTGFGIGAIAGSVIVMKLLDRVPPLKLACGGILLLPVALWIVAFRVSWPVVAVVLVATGLIVPLVNAPFMGILSTRPPLSLRAKVMTATLTASGLGGPLGRLLVGPVYGLDGNGAVWVMIAGGITLGALLFVLAAWRGSTGDATDLVAVPPVAHG
jgi:predicted MFS family arabinose efflux permease